MVQGLARLNKKLTVTLPKRVEAATRKAMETGAKELVEMMKRLVPVDQGDLRASIGWSWGAPPKGSAIIASSPYDSRGMRIVIYAGNKEAYYARWQEFGTVNMAANPFFFPSWRSLRKRIKSRITREMKKAVKAEFPA
ncbi:HK97 gp10 family phage protein [Rhizobium sp. ARZ01]|uniref:HK97-gp10 family putative phage morphogenesis protein n=1 Tax=Rhizobium sp. ARZ01 TaxID=2769313 RepID=UPI0017823030|nr:HK97-gp10 family putative phage morphogenesis protein [Rhizobium sp. ARZ01]MBD9372111.1 HK97 gp10 family phage protein [Rhizobium sp. ARZ01]